MRRIIRTSLLVLAFSCACYAGEIPNNVTVAGEIPNNAQVKGDIQNGISSTTEPQTVAITAPEIALNWLQSVLTLF
jgi:hypothetical protein